MQITVDLIRRIARQELQIQVSNYGLTNGAGSGGGAIDLSAYASKMYINANYLSKAFFNSLFAQRFNKHVVVTDANDNVISDTTTEETAEPNTIVVNGTTTESDTPQQGQTTTTTITIIGTRANHDFWSVGGVSALGYGAGGSGGGGASALYQLADVKANAGNTAVYGLDGTSADIGKVLMYGSDGKWFAGTVQGGGSGTVTSVGMIVPNGFSVTPAVITSTGFFSVTFASGYSLPTTSKQTEWNDAVTDVNTLKGYFTSGVANSALKLATARTIWGQSFDGTGNVTGDMTNVGHITADTQGTKGINGFCAIEMYGPSGNNANGGYIDFHYSLSSSDNTSRIIEYASGILSINDQLYATKNGNVGIGVPPVSGYKLKVAGSEYITSGNLFLDTNQSIHFNDKNVLTLNNLDTLAIGDNTRQAGYTTDIQGDPITFATNNGQSKDSRLEVGEFSEAGRFWVKQGTQGIRIGDGLITWDATNNALKVSAYNGGAANLYALGGVSALGYSGSGGSNTDSSYSKSYTMPYRGSSTSDRYWQKLGRYTMNADAQVLTIDVFTGNGYNGTANQNAWARIMIKKAYQPSPSVNNSVGVTCEQFGPAISNGKILVRVSASAYNQGDVWIKCPWGYPMGAYTVNGNYSAWEHNSEQSPVSSDPTQNLQSVGYYDSTKTMTTGE